MWLGAPKQISEDAPAQPEWVRLATACWQLPSHLHPVGTEVLGLLSAARFVSTLLREGAVGHQPQLASPTVEADMLRAAARPQLWHGASRPERL